MGLAGQQMAGLAPPSHHHQQQQQHQAAAAAQAVSTSVSSSFLAQAHAQLAALKSQVS